MVWVVVVICTLMAAVTGFMVGVAYGQEHWNEIGK